MDTGAREDCVAINHQANQHKACSRNFVIVYQKGLPVGESIATQSTILDSNSKTNEVENNDEQQSEYDSPSDEEKLQAE